MDRRYYSLTSLEQELQAYERRFGMDTRQFFDVYRADQLPADMPRFEAFCWADTWTELERLRVSEGVGAC